MRVPQRGDLKVFFLVYATSNCSVFLPPLMKHSDVFSLKHFLHFAGCSGGSKVDITWCFPHQQITNRAPGHPKRYLLNQQMVLFNMAQL